MVYIIETFSFVSIGILSNEKPTRENILFGIGLSVIVIFARILSAFLTTIPLELTRWSKDILSNKERLFIAIAGFRGLTTAVLALLAYISLAPINEVEADRILYTSLTPILISGIIQGILPPKVTQRMGPNVEKNAKLNN